MKRMVKALAAVVMVIGATTAVGCSRPSDKASDGAEAVAPVETPATAPVVEESSAKDEPATKAASTTSPGIEQNSVRFGVSARVGGPRYYAPHAPPAARFEVRTAAPSARHFWAPGYWRWSGRQYTWIGGRWELNRPHHVYNAPRWVAAGPRWQYVPGHWVRRY